MPRFLRAHEGDRCKWEDRIRLPEGLFYASCMRAAKFRLMPSSTRSIVTPVCAEHLATIAERDL